MSYLSDFMSSIFFKYSSSLPNLFMLFAVKLYLPGNFCDDVPHFICHLFCALSFVFIVFLRNLPMVVITSKDIFLSQYFQLCNYFLFHRFILASSFFPCLGVFF